MLPSFDVRFLFGSRFPLRFFEVKNSTSSPHIQLQQKEAPPPPKTLTAHEIKKMEDSLRVEAKDLVEQIKNQRNKLKTDGDDAEFILQIPGQTTPPQLFGEPKRRRLLKGHFGKVSQQPDTRPNSFLVQGRARRLHVEPSSTQYTSMGKINKIDPCHFKNPLFFPHLYLFPPNLV